jgi:hypothetical protein
VRRLRLNPAARKNGRLVARNCAAARRSFATASSAITRSHSGAVPSRTSPSALALIGQPCVPGTLSHDHMAATSFTLGMLQPALQESGASWLGGIPSPNRSPSSV